MSVLIFILGFVVGITYLMPTVVEQGCAEYNTTTGAFKWKDIQ